MLKCIILDDEPLAIDILEFYVVRHDHLTLVKSFTDPYAALELLQEQRVDLLFLDIQMPDLSGLQLLEKLETPPELIFTTAHPEYAVQGFEVDAVDYLLKPFSYERFEEAISRARGQMDMTEKPTHLFLKSGYDHVKVMFDEIQVIKGEKDYLRIYRTQKPSFLTLKSMKEILRELPVHKFLRVHRSYIVSIPHIDKIEPRAILVGNFQIPIGPTYQEKVKERLREQM